jgi:hypothetical protein
MMMGVTMRRRVRVRVRVRTRVRAMVREMANVTMVRVGVLVIVRPRVAVKMETDPSADKWASCKRR